MAQEAGGLQIWISAREVSKEMTQLGSRGLERRPRCGESRVPLNIVGEDKTHPVLVEVERQLGEYFGGKRET
jgi:hypothetical protein